MGRVSDIVIVGGGSAGWITAGRIAAEYDCMRNPDITVTLVESPNIRPIGVGEGTWPTLRQTLLTMGVSETEFIRECDVSFKQGAKFVNWVTGQRGDAYYHPLMLPHNFGKINLPFFWEKFRGADSNISFSDAVCMQEAICESGLAPKKITTPEYASLANYAYHLDSAKLGTFLQYHCIHKLGVKHILADVIDVKKSENGYLESLVTEQTDDINGDLFVDCTGFSSRLLGQEMGARFIDKSDILFIDTALAAHVPYDHEDAAIASHTISTATDAGWIWDIGLQSRRGTGYVYSSRHCTQERAHETYQAYLGKAHKDLSIRTIPIASGHREKFWIKNCVGVGLSAGFLEPLEASALVLVELSAQFIAEQLPAHQSSMEITAKRFNSVFQYRWDRIIDFLKLHYILTKRTDSAFWVDNYDPATIPESLTEQLELWKYRVPNNSDFDSNNEVFPAASYQYVLYGMGFETDMKFANFKSGQGELAKSTFQSVMRQKEKMISDLPTNRQLLNKINHYGLQKV